MTKSIRATCPPRSSVSSSALIAAHRPVNMNASSPYAHIPTVPSPTGFPPITHTPIANATVDRYPNAILDKGSDRAPVKHFTPLVQQFLDYLRLEKHFSDYTIKSYGADLIQFGQFLIAEIGPNANALDKPAATPQLAD